VGLLASRSRPDLREGSVLWGLVGTHQSQPSLPPFCPPTSAPCTLPGGRNGLNLRQRSVSKLFLARGVGILVRFLREGSVFSSVFCARGRYSLAPAIDEQHRDESVDDQIGQSSFWPSPQHRVADSQPGRLSMSGRRLRSGRASEGTGQAISPVMPSASRMVARTRKPGQERSSVSTSSAHAPIRYSQLSNRSSSSLVRTWSECV
jgi:hypothetical protein